MNYHIKQCHAPCQGYISKEEYATRIEQAVRFLNGEYQPIMQELEEKMQRASSELAFERPSVRMELSDITASIPIEPSDTFPL
ncbi:MAG: hypothetical protein BHW44_00360 [Roseburia sp. 40_7]|nr:MAG: hypothetical protein BHW44_00360 [Roseburia sp. 40_7]